MPEIEVVIPGFTMGTDQTMLGLSSVTLIKGRHNILVDVGSYGRRVLLQQALEKRGLSPNDIDVVVLTHLHWDHSQNVDLFPSAEFLLHSDALEYSKAPRKSEWAIPQYFSKTLEGLRVRGIDEGDEVEPGVRCLHTPGHSRGHMSVVVETSQGPAVIAGDALSDAGTIDRGTPALIFWNEEEARASIRKILDAASVIYPGHDRPFRVNSDGSTQYLGGASSIRVLGQLERGAGSVAVTLDLEAPWATTVIGAP